LRLGWEANEKGKTLITVYTVYIVSRLLAADRVIHKTANQMPTLYDGGAALTLGFVTLSKHDRQESRRQLSDY